MVPVYERSIAFAMYELVGDFTHKRIAISVIS